MILISNKLFLGLKKVLARYRYILCPKTSQFWNPERFFYMQDGGTNRYMKAFLENNRCNRKCLIEWYNIRSLLFLVHILLCNLYLQEAGYNCRVGIIVKRVRMTFVFLTLISNSTPSTKYTCSSLKHFNYLNRKSTSYQIVCDKNPTEFVSYIIDTETTVN